MEAVGDACEQQGQMEAARELYLAAPNSCAALRIINRQLSDLIRPAITDQAASTPPCMLMNQQHVDQSLYIVCPWEGSSNNQYNFSGLTRGADKHMCKGKNDVEMHLRRVVWSRQLKWSL